MSEKLYHDASSCVFEASFIAPTDTKEWKVAEESEDSLPCVISKKNSTIQLAPSKRWIAQDHFNDDLCLPEGIESLCCQWQANARESVALVLSPKADYVSGRSYTVVLGSEGNTRTGISLDRTHNVTVPSRVCVESSWTSYWLCCIRKDASTFVYVGVGNVLGENCITFLEHAMNKDDVEKEPMVRYIGLGNRAKFDRQAPAPLRMRDFRISTVPSTVSTQLLQLKPENLEIIQIGVESMDEETRSLMLKYKNECQKARQRASKFGIAYKEPPADVFMPWSQQRKLKANMKPGFRTGMDLSAPGEKAKQEARRKRFGLPEVNQETVDLSVTEVKSLSVEQAWHNEKLVGRFRVDPHTSLWARSPEDVEQNDSMKEMDDPPRIDAKKIHMFSIDWSAFKQIRTQDIMKHFADYGPTYVEWLSDLSCNIHFEDEFSASRALENLSSKLPSPAPESGIQEGGQQLPDLGAMGWRLSRRLLRKISTDKYGIRGTTTRTILRMSTTKDLLEERPTSWPKPPPGFSTKRILGPNSDFPTRKKSKRAREDIGALNENGEPATLDTALSSGRDGGFTVEEMGLERAQKKAKST